MAIVTYKSSLRLSTDGTTFEILPSTSIENNLSRTTEEITEHATNEGFVTRTLLLGDTSISLSDMVYKSGDAGIGMIRSNVLTLEATPLYSKLFNNKDDQRGVVYEGRYLVETVSLNFNKSEIVKMSATLQGAGQLTRFDILLSSSELDVLADTANNNFL